MIVLLRIKEGLRDWLECEFVFDSAYDEFHV